MKKTRFIFVRHAEAMKNLKDITGGEGTELTSLGYEQAKKVINDIKKYCDINCVKVYTSPITQAVLTAQIIANELGVDYRVSNDIKPSDMGILTGLSTDEIKMNFPKEYEILMKWRRKEIDVSEFRIPLMMNPLKFWEQIMAFISDTKNECVNVIVCTRSIMVLIDNYLNGHTPYRGGNYKHVDVPNCKCYVFDIFENGECTRIE